MTLDKNVLMIETKGVLYGEKENVFDVEYSEIGRSIADRVRCVSSERSYEKDRIKIFKCQR